MRKKIAILNCDTEDGEFLDCNQSNYLHGVIFDSRYCQKNISLVTFKTHKGEFPKEEFDAIIITGSSQHIVTGIENLPFWVNDLMVYLRSITVPVLGIGFGMDVITYMFNGTLQFLGEIEDGNRYQLGFQPVVLTDEGRIHPLFAKLPEIFYSAMIRAVVITDVPYGSIILAEDDLGVSSFQYKNYLGIQFHPEMNLNCVKRSLHRRLASIPDNSYRQQFKDALGTVDEQYRSSHGNEAQIIIENFLRI